MLLSGYFSILAALDGLGTNRPGEEDEHGTDLWCQGINAIEAIKARVLGREARG